MTDAVRTFLGMQVVKNWTMLIPGQTRTERWWHRLRDWSKRRSSCWKRPGKRVAPRPSATVRSTSLNSMTWAISLSNWALLWMTWSSACTLPLTTQPSKTAWVGSADIYIKWCSELCLWMTWSSACMLPLTTQPSKTVWVVSADTRI